MRTSTGAATAVSIPVILLLVAVGSVYLSGPPTAAGDATSPSLFAASRAVRHVRDLAVSPHPMGSAEHARVREDLVQRLESLGFRVERQRTTGLRVRGPARARGPVAAGLVENLLVRLPGRSSTGVVLLACHYDSVAASPGAADDMAAVAALLETLRALKTGVTLRNDIVALFTDGEEDGLLGAEAFVSRHPWAREVRAVFNLEARGTRGPVQMFETTAGNAPLIKAWATAIPTPAGTSLAYEVYKRLPNDSDFTEFKRLNAVGLNFAFIGNLEGYHTTHDAAIHLDAGSVQGHGDAALSMARTLGEADLDLARWRGSDAVFFTLPGGYAVQYPVWWALPLAVAVFLLWLWLLARSRRLGAASYGGVIVAVVLIVPVLGGLVWLGTKVPTAVQALQTRIEPIASPATAAPYALGLAVLALTVWLALFLIARIRFAAHTLALAGALVLIVAGGALAWWLPGASYLVMWPACASLLSVLALPAAKNSGRSDGPGAASVLALLLSAVPVLAITVPTGALLWTALLLGPEGAAGIMAFVGIAACALVPQAEAATRARGWWLAGVVALAGIGAVLAGPLSAAHGPTHPRAENVVYALDADAGRAVWATTVDPPGAWLSQFVGADPKRGPLVGFTTLAGSQAVFLQREARTVSVPAPQVTLVRASSEPGGRVLVLRIASPRRARSVSVRIPDGEVFDTWVNGRRPVGTDVSGQWLRGRWGLEFSNVPADGIELGVRVKGAGPVTFIVADRSEGLPDAVLTGLATRPVSSHPIHRGDTTIVQKTATF